MKFSEIKQLKKFLGETLNIQDWREFLEEFIDHRDDEFSIGEPSFIFDGWEFVLLDNAADLAIDKLLGDHTRFLNTDFEGVQLIVGTGVANATFSIVREACPEFVADMLARDMQLNLSMCPNRIEYMLDALKLSQCLEIIDVNNQHHEFWIGDDVYYAISAL